MPVCSPLVHWCGGALLQTTIVQASQCNPYVGDTNCCFLSQLVHWTGGMNLCFSKAIPTPRLQTAAAQVNPYICSNDGAGPNSLRNPEFLDT